MSQPNTGWADGPGGETLFRAIADAFGRAADADLAAGCTCSAPDYQDEHCPLHGRGATGCLAT